MSRRLSDLEGRFGAIVKDVLIFCKSEGYTMIPFYTLRSVWTQAQLFRQSRSTKEIREAINYLKLNNANFLAKVLKDVGPQYGRWATNCLPGESYHNHGLAIDCFALINGKAIWNIDHPAYYKYSTKAQQFGLYSGYFWMNKDAVHIQAKNNRITDFYSWKKIDELMEEKFSAKEK